MHEHDTDLVAALAEGTLDGTEATAAEAAIAACPRCAADLAAQRTAVEATGSLGTARLTDAERTDLRASIASAVGLDLHPAPVESPTKRRRGIPWPSVAVAALSVLAVVAVVPLIGTLTTSGSDDAASSVELALTSSTVAEEQELDAAADDQAGGDADGERELAAATEAPTTTLAATAESGDTFTAAATLDEIVEAADELLELAEPAPGRACGDAAADLFDDFADVSVAPVPLGDGEGRAYLVSPDGETVEGLVVFAADGCDVVLDTR